MHAQFWCSGDKMWALPIFWLCTSHSFSMFVWRCVWMCIECVCEGISTFYYANSPWTLVSMKIIKIGMTCKVVYFSLYIPLLCNCISKKHSEQCFKQDSLSMNMENILNLYLIFLSSWEWANLRNVLVWYSLCIYYW